MFFPGLRWLGGGVELRARSIDDENFSYPLYRLCCQRLADLGYEILPLHSIITQDAYLDEFMAFEREVDFPQHLRREAGCSDHDDGMQVVRFCLERLTFSWCKFLHLCESQVASRRSCCLRSMRRGVTIRD